MATRSRPLRRALVVLGALVLVAGCSGDGETTTASGLALPDETTGTAEGPEAETTTSAESGTTTEPAATTTAPDPEADAVATACSAFTDTLLTPIGAEPADDDTAFVAALEVLVADGPEPAAPAAASMLGLLDAEDAAAAGTLSPDEADAARAAGYAGVEVLLDWAQDACPIEGIVWSCAATTGARVFTPVGESIDGPGATTTTVPGASSPEEVYDEADSEGEPVEVSRTDDEVVVAWLDAEGHAVEVLTVVDASGWRSGGTEICDDDPLDRHPTAGEDVEPVGEPIS